MSERSKSERILARHMARDLTDAEIERISGGGNPYPTPVEVDTADGMDFDWVIVTDLDT